VPPQRNDLIFAPTDAAKRDELIPTYEAEVVRLEDTSARLRKERAGAKWWLVLLVLAPVGFYFGPFVAFAIFFASIGLWGITLYLTSVRLTERSYELARCREELERLRATE
jgi:hypothetical protein